MRPGRPQIDLDAYREQVTALYEQKTSIKEISAIIQKDHGVSAKEKTIRRRLKAWGIQQQRAPQGTVANEVLQQRIETLICDDHLSTKEILRVLETEGTPISLSTLATIRKQKLGIQLRVDDPLQRQRQKWEIRAILNRELRFGHIEGLGRGRLHTYLRGQRRIFAR